MTVWSFRKVTNSKKDIKEIEYLVFACIWGTAIVAVYAEIMKSYNIDKLHNLLSNPLASGLVFATWGLIMGSLCGLIEKRVNVVRHLGRISRSFFGR